MSVLKIMSFKGSIMLAMVLVPLQFIHVLSDKKQSGTKLDSRCSVCPGDYPYVAFILLKNSRCSSSILSPWWVLSAAHCFNEISQEDKSLLVVYAQGSRDMSLPGPQVRSVDKVYVYPAFFHQWQQFDAALVKLSEPFIFNEFVGAVTLASNSLPEWGEVCTALGHGGYKPKKDPNIPLKLVDLVAVNNRECLRALGLSHLFKKNICGFGDEHTGVYNGDFGGPMICQGMQVGISQAISKNVVNMRYRGGDHVFLFAPVSELIYWIKHHVAEARTAELQ